MPDLSILTTGELGTAEAAAETLMKLHDKHQVLDRGVYVGLGTLLADVHMVQEDHAAAERRHKVAQAARRATEIPA
jgi:hypothetical protein